MNKIALLFDRAYIDAHPCFTELANHLAINGFLVDLFMFIKSNNHHPFFENQNIQMLPFPDSKFQKAEYWSKIMYSKDRKYCAAFGTPVQGAWVAYKTAKIQRIPYYYLADELIEQIIANSPLAIQEKLEKRNYLANRNAAASIALSEERYQIQKISNKISYSHDHIVIPNSQSGNSKRIKSNYFRDYFDIEDRKPILLFAGTLDWILAKRIFEETKNYGERDYHLIFHSRTLGMMGEENHPFIKMSKVPLPGMMLNYALSSADIGLALYDKRSIAETRNAFTGGKIGTYLKNELPLIVGNAAELKIFEKEGVGKFWEGEGAFDEVAYQSITNIEKYRKNISDFYKRNLQYEFFFEELKNHIMKSIRD
jgi:hypothetical protein